MDKTKYKSVAVSIDIYKKLQKLAEESDRSVSRQIAHMVKMHEQRKLLDLKSLPVYHTGRSPRLPPWAGLHHHPKGLNFVLEGESDERCVLAIRRRGSQRRQV